jgi:hypothetical protein
MTTFRRLFSVLAFSALLPLTGCQDAPVGDPCVPENTPAGGFLQGEAYLETSSVQCRTRVCMVYMAGETAPPSLDPSTSREQCELTMGGGAPACAGFPSEEQIEERVYCTCRCQAPEGSGTPTCACGDGFTCVEDLLVLGGDGIRGGYCVRDTTAPAE